MTQDQIMELVQVYASAWALVGSRFDNGNGMADALEAKAEVVAAIEQLTKDAERYRWFADIATTGAFDRAEAAFACFEDAEACTKAELDQAIDAAIAAQTEQV